jgi:hypothetical protein
MRTVAREAEASAVHEKAYELGVTPLQVMSDNLAFYVAKGDRVMSQNIARDLAPFLHPKLSNIDVSGRIATQRLPEIKWTQAEADAAADRDMAAFVEWVPPVTRTIEHRPVDEPPKVPEVPVEKIEPGPVRDYAAPGKLEAAPDVKRLRDYRPARGGSQWAR